MPVNPWLLVAALSVVSASAAAEGADVTDQEVERFLAFVRGGLDPATYEHAGKLNDSSLRLLKQVSNCEVREIRRRSGSPGAAIFWTCEGMDEETTPAAMIMIEGEKVTQIVGTQFVPMRRN